MRSWSSPPPLLEAVEHRCEAWPEGALAGRALHRGRGGEPVRAGSFDVVLADTGLTLTVPPHRSVLSVLAAADRRAGDCMMLCVSRSMSPRLVLDR